MEIFKILGHFSTNHMNTFKLKFRKTNPKIAVFYIVTIFVSYDLVFETGISKRSELRRRAKEIRNIQYFC